MTITDHTTAIAQRASKGKGRAQDPAAGRSAADASLKHIEHSHERIVNAALRILSDEQAHLLAHLCTKYADFRGLKEEYGLSTQQVRAMLAAHPDIHVGSDKGVAFAVSQSVMDRAHGKKDASRTSTPVGNGRSASVASTREPSYFNSPGGSNRPWGPQRLDVPQSIAKNTPQRPSMAPPSTPPSQILEEGDDLFGPETPSNGENPGTPAAERDVPTIGKTSIRIPDVPASIRKQPVLPPQLLSDRPSEMSPANGPPSSPKSQRGDRDLAAQPLFRHSSVDKQEEDVRLPPPLTRRPAEGDFTTDPAVNQPEDVFGEEIPLDMRHDAADISGGRVDTPLMEIDEEVKPENSSLSHDTRRMSISTNSRRPRRDQDRIDLDDSGDEVAAILGASRKPSRVRKTQRVESIVLGYRGKAGEEGPPGMRDKTSRDSSAQGDSDMEDDDAESSQMPARTAGPSRPTVQKSNSAGIDDDDDDDDDVIVVTSVRAGATPVRVKSKEEKEAEREARYKAKEAERIKREGKKKRPIPTFRHQEAEEDIELHAAYDARKARLGDLPVEDEPTSWELIESFEAPKGRGKRPDWNTCKFWPYNLPFPGRQEGEAIVAVAGGCNIRCYRLSEARGVSEIWNAVDESANWEREEDRESYQAMAWTYEVRQEAAISPYWRKWPLLLVAGYGREIKVLDGYSGTTLKIIQGHGATISTLAVHPTLPHVVASGSFDESISIWDISVSVSLPETIGTSTNALEEDKRRQGYIDGERLCVFAGAGGHVEPILSIDFHPSLPLLVSGGADCKLRIWRVPDDLPAEATECNTKPTPIAPPRMSRRPTSVSFPMFMQKSMHSHHIDHVSWVGHEGYILSRALCFDSPAKRVFRLFKPTFFYTFQREEAVAPDHIGLPVQFPPETELFARWTMAASSENIGDGLVCMDNELLLDQRGRLASQRLVYMPTVEPAVHVYPIDTTKKQANLAAEKHAYKIRLGEEVVLDENKRHNAQLRAVAVQSAGRGWMVGVGELEKLVVWKKAEPLDMDKVQAALQRRMEPDEHMSEVSEDEIRGLPNGHLANGHATDGFTPDAQELPNGNVASPQAREADMDKDRIAPQVEAALEDYPHQELPKTGDPAAAQRAMSVELPERPAQPVPEAMENQHPYEPVLAVQQTERSPSVEYIG